jgi:cell wall assembly regulator SMI1
MLNEANKRWNSIEQAFTSRGCAPSDLFEPPATDDDIKRLQSVTSLSLPPEAEAFYRVHNGQRLGIRGVLFGIELLSIDRIIENWRNWESVSGDGLNEDLADSMSSKPPDYIKPLYSNLQWLPLTHDQGGNHIGLDFDPASKGTCGQVIAFGRDFDEKKLIAPDFGRFIDMFIVELNTIDWAFSKSGWRIDDPQRGEIHYYDWPRILPPECTS